MLVAVLLTTLSTPGLAANLFGYRFEVTPYPVQVGQEITVTVQELDRQCGELPSSLYPALEPGNILRLSLQTDDACENRPLQTKSYSLGTLPAGRYTFRFVICGEGSPLPDPPPYECVLVEDIGVRVRGVREAAHRVPVFDRMGAVILAMLLGAGGIFFGRGTLPSRMD